MRKLALLLLATAVFVPAGLAASDARAPQVSMRATFVQAEFKTVYKIVIARPGGRTIGNVRWRFTKPPREPGCTQFSGKRLDATWLHGDQHGCLHEEAAGPRGHEGVVRAGFTLGNLSCRVTFRGSETDTARGRCS
jgi:hypothetical protein